MDIDTLVQQVTDLSKDVLVRPEVQEFKKGMCLWINVYPLRNTAVTVLRINKKTLTVRQYGLVGNNKHAAEPKNYPTMEDRAHKVEINALLQNGCYEISRHEIAFCLYVSWLRRKLEKLAKAQEMACCVGSKRYNDLKSGSLKPRKGDFVKSKSTKCCGFVVNSRIYQDTMGFGVTVEDANGVVDFISENDVQFVAPYEWGYCNEQ
jgi:hypothetical protein